jgi:prepilin-type N-terminal cleavage/methylation domain-containing protein
MKNNFQKGLTLIELMSVVAMVTIVTGIVFANYGIGRDSMALERASQKLYQDFRLVINTAMSGSNEYSGVGIYFDESNSTQYIIYKDTNDNRIYDSGGGETLYTINIESGVKISDIAKTSGVLTYNGGGNTNIGAIFFKSPYPTVYLNPSATNSIQGIERYTVEQISIVLSTTDTGNIRTKTITINNSGMVNIN